MTDNITKNVTDNILAELGVIEAKVSAPERDTSTAKVASDRHAATEAEAKSQRLWANMSGRKTTTPTTSRQVVPVDPTISTWDKDNVLVELEHMRQEGVQFSADEAHITTKNFEKMVGIITSDMLNCVEQGGFIVNSGVSIVSLKTLIGVWLVTQCKQRNDTDYMPIVVTD